MVNHDSHINLTAMHVQSFTQATPIFIITHIINKVSMHDLVIYLHIISILKNNLSHD